MLNKNYRTVWNTYTLVSLGVLTAIQLILSRLLAINIGGFSRIALGPVATIMAGLWFGPAGGALTGFTADLLGCLMQGYAVNPFITISAVLWGVIPALLKPDPSQKKSRKILTLTLSVLLSATVCTLFFTPLGLVLINGFDLRAILPGRLLQYVLMVPIYSLLVCLLYMSPATAIVQQGYPGKSSAFRNPPGDTL